MPCQSEDTQAYRGQPAYIAEHLLQRQFEADAPMQKLVTDFTYLPFGGKTLYLSSVLDLFNGEIVAYIIADKQDTAFVLDTLGQLPIYLALCSIVIRAAFTPLRHIKKL